MILALFYLHIYVSTHIIAAIYSSTTTNTDLTEISMNQLISNQNEAAHPINVLSFNQHAPNNQSHHDDDDYEHKRDQQVPSTNGHDHHHHVPSSIHIPLLLETPYLRSKSSIQDELHNFRISLKYCALDHSSSISTIFSYFIFILLSIIIPLITSFNIKVPATAPANDPLSFNKIVQLPESVLSLIGFLTLSRFFSKYGLRHLLFLDCLHDDSYHVRSRYAMELDKAFKYLTWIILPSFIVELAHKLLFFSNVVVVVGVPSVIFGGHETSSSVVVPAVNLVVFLCVLMSWVYRTVVFLLVCVLFRLTCELQILRLEALKKMLEGCGSDAGVIFREHLRIKKQASATSHRYRLFIIGCLFTISVSQLGALLLVLASKSEKSFFNSGDLVVCSAVQLSGFFLCLMGAARITHRAQGIISVGTRWHMIVTSASGHHHDHHHQNKKIPSLPSPEAGDHGVPRLMESDDDGADYYQSHLAPICSDNPHAFHTRQALVWYLQHNNEGITLFGFPLDRGLLQTLFAFEMSWVLWILSKVVVLSD